MSSTTSQQGLSVAPGQSTSRKFTRLFLIGFSMSTVVLASLVTYQYFSLQSEKQKYESVARNHHTKLNLVVQMRSAAHERTLALQKMLLQPDPFIRDEEWLRFNQYAAEFARSRLAILGMALTEQEKKLLDYQGDVTKDALDSQKRVVELMEKEQFIVARDVLLRNVIPSKEQVINQLNAFYHFQLKEAQDIAKKVTGLNQQFNFLAALTVLVIAIFGLAIVYYVVRRSNRSEDEHAAAYKNLLHQSEEKSQFLSELIDEFRYPLNSLARYSKSISEQVLQLEHKHKEILSDAENIKNACQHLNGLTSDIRELTNAESGKFALASSEIDIYEFVNDTAKQIKPIAAKYNNQIDLQCPPHIGTIDTDPTKLKQILFNLLANACKYTEFGLITLSVKPITVKSADSEFQRWVTFSVIDTGIGIAPDKVDKIFSPNRGFHKVRQKSAGTSGLNLSISRRMAHVLGGEISVNSEPGMGSVFSIKLPYGLPQTSTTVL